MVGQRDAGVLPAFPGKQFPEHPVPRQSPGLFERDPSRGRLFGAVAVGAQERELQFPGKRFAETRVLLRFLTPDPVDHMKGQKRKRQKLLHVKKAQKKADRIRSAR